ncbi:siderophore-iron reductase FhuF [Neobacillus sp. FSL H8-0543]|uniref:siderophore-iron reductase FhuF n=1 Tax=Neobacillus sp. FSL H8-0543 TaxID=2954672 RepID=UPI003158D5FE
MVKLLEENGLLHLQKYRLSSNLQHTFTIADLMDKTLLANLFKELTYSLGTPSEKVAASIFIKRYAFIAVISLYAMSASNKKINLSMDNIEMEKPERGKDWLPKISLKDLSIEEWNGEDRDEWRRETFRELFANNIYPIIEQLEKNYKISRLILWENIAIYLFWLYETELKNSDNPYVKSDFHYLFSEAEGELFGRYHNNPLQKYQSEKKYLEEFQEEIRVRKTCCFSYQLPSSKRCKTCPCTYIAKDGGCYDGESICSAVRSFT